MADIFGVTVPLPSPTRGITRNLKLSLPSLLDAIQSARNDRALADGHYFAHVARKFIQLGDLQYEVAGPVAGLDSQLAFDYPEHAVLEGKPRLQFAGEGLEQITLTLELHSAYCDPDLEIAALRAAGAAHQAMPLVRADGHVRGRFVVTQLDEVLHQTAVDGAVIAASVRVTLREWVADQTLELTTPQRRARTVATRSTAATKKSAAAKPGTPATPAGEVTLDEMLRRASLPTPSHP